jgi:MFS family permease
VTCSRPIWLSPRTAWGNSGESVGVGCGAPFEEDGVAPAAVVSADAFADAEGAVAGGVVQADACPVLGEDRGLQGPQLAAQDLYRPAFAALTRWWGPRRVTALTGLTLLAGLASTVFAPVTAALLAGLGWRHAYLVLALVLALVTIPAHLLGLRGPWPPAEHAESAVAGLLPGQVVRSRAFLLSVATITAGTFAAFAVVVNQVPLFLERGLSTSTAAWALGLGGVGQVSGRLFYRALSTRLGVRARTVAVLTGVAAGTALLAVLPGPAVLLIAAAMLTGAARGVFTLLQATAVTDRWGATHYGRLSGILSAPALLATAVAPWAGSALAAVLGGYPALFVVLAGVPAAQRCSRSAVSRGRSTPWTGRRQCSTARPVTTEASQACAAICTASHGDPSGGV